MSTTPINKVSFYNLNVVGEITIGGQTGIDITPGDNIHIGAGSNESPVYTTPDNIIAIGNGALSSVDNASNSIAIGQNALSNLDSGDCNIAIGEDAGTSLGTGSVNNVAIGCSSLSANSGSDLDENVFVGFNAGRVFAASSTVGIGARALNDATTSIGNTSVGFQSLAAITTGSDNNTAIGSNAGVAASNCNECVMIGVDAMGLQISPSSSVAIGNAACQVGTVADCVSVGNSSTVGVNSTNFDRCVCVGSGSLQTSSLASNTDLIVIGQNSATDIDNVDNLICIGRNSCNGNTLSGNNNIVIGSNSANVLTTGTGNVLIGSDIGAALTTGSDNILIGRNNNVDIGSRSDSILMGINQTTEASNEFKLGNNFVQMRMRGLSVHAAANQITYDGATGLIKALASAAKYKSDIQDIDALIDTSQVYNLQPRTFTFTAPNGKPQHNKFGIVADEADQYIPQLTIKDVNDEISGFAYTLLPVVMLNEMKKEKPNWDRSEQCFQTDEIDLSIAKTIDISIPQNTDFYPDTISIVQITTGTDDATLQFGDDTDPTKYGTVHHGNNSSNTNTILSPLLSNQNPNSNILRITVIPSNAGTCKIFWRGLYIH